MVYLWIKLLLNIIITLLSALFCVPLVWGPVTNHDHTCHGTMKIRHVHGFHQHTIGTSRRESVDVTIIDRRLPLPLSVTPKMIEGRLREVLEFDQRLNSARYELIKVSYLSRAFPVTPKIGQVMPAARISRVADRVCHVLIGCVGGWEIRMCRVFLGLCVKGR